MSSGISPRKLPLASATCAAVAVTALVLWPAEPLEAQVAGPGDGQTGLSDLAMLLANWETICP